MNERPDLPDDAQTIDLTLPAINVQFQIPLDESGRVVTLVTVVPQHCTDRQFNEVLDKLSRAAERQKALINLPTNENLLEEKKAALVLENNKLFLARSEYDTQKELWAREASAANRRNWRPNPQQIQTQKKLEATIAQAEQTIRVLEKKIASEGARLTLYKDRLVEED